MIDLSDENKLELMRLESEHARVYGAKVEMLYIIAQREAEIKRISLSVAVQDKRLLELTNLIAKIKGV